MANTSFELPATLPVIIVEEIVPDEVHLSSNESGDMLVIEKTAKTLRTKTVRKPS